MGRQNTICGKCGLRASSNDEVKACYQGVKNAHDPLAQVEEARDNTTRRGMVQKAWGPGGALTAQRGPVTMHRRNGAPVTADRLAAPVPPAPPAPSADEMAAERARRREEQEAQERADREEAVRRQAEAQERATQNRAAFDAANAWKKLPAGKYELNGETFIVKIGTDSHMPYAMKVNAAGGTHYVGNGPVREMTILNRVGDITETEKKTTRKFTDDDAGMYRSPDGTRIMKVYKAVHGSGEMCAKRMVVNKTAEHDSETGDVTKPAEVEFKYVGHANENVPADFVLVTLDEAVAFGEVYGICMRCGAPLTKEESILAGIGSTCITYFPDGAERIAAAKAERNRRAAGTTAVKAATRKPAARKKAATRKPTRRA